jgi:NAD(P)-dependent dehydrogenase (short-subunit alcohol dehydrogenase family)
MDKYANNLSDKVCLVTGATSGIGEVTAEALATMGASVVMLSRNPGRCTRTAERIRSKSGNPAVDFLVADLSSQAEIRRVATEFRQRYDRLDILVNNAGGFFLKRQESSDGIELTFALNHLNYFLLTNLLLDLLKASAPARIVNVSSGAHNGGRIDFEDLQGKRSYGGWKAYSQSKLANVLFTYELARRLDGDQVTVNALHPGFVATGFAKNNGWFASIGLSIVHLFARKPEEGARTVIYLASSPEVAGVTGKYFHDGKPVPSDPVSYNVETARKLWQVSAQMVGLEGV